ncbi:T9SS type A sorting domain-containing protein [bacterium]|nr:T9SS type A sorting domain-containing protein [bacterium]
MHDLLTLAGFAFLFLGVGAYAQDMDTLWTRVYPTAGGSGCQRLFDIGNQLLLIGSHGVDGHTDVLLRWISYEGAPLDSILLETEGTGLVTWDAAYVSDSEVYLFGSVRSTLDSFFVARISTSGEWIWQNRFVSPGVLSTQDIRAGCVTLDHEVVTVGTATVWNGEVYLPHYWVVWLDTLGNIVDSTNISFVNSGDFHARSVTPARNGGILVAGEGFDGMYFVRLDSDRSIVWWRRVGHPSFRHSVNRVVQDSDGTFYYCATVYDWQLGGQDYGDDAVIGALSERGDSLWARVIHIEDNQRPAAIVITCEGNLVVSGKNQLNVFPDDMLVISATKTANIRSVLIPDSPFHQTLSDVIQLPDSTFMVAGTGFLPQGPFNMFRFSACRISQDGHIASVPSMPVAITPLNGDTLPSPVTFSWTPSFDPDPFDTVSYLLTLSNGLDTTVFPPQQASESVLAVDSVFSDSASHSYLWNVGAMSGAPDTIVWCDSWQTFHLLSSSAQPQIPSALIVDATNAFPNPFNSYTTLSFALGQTSPVEMVVHDVLGRVVRSEKLGVMQAGEHRIGISASDLASGSYWVTLEANRFREAKKIVVVR